MSLETIVAIYDSIADADGAVRDLETAGVPSSAISRQAGTPATTGSGQAQPVRGKGFWSNLFGGEPDHDVSVYDRSVNSGSSIVAVKVAEEHIHMVTGILERHSPVDVDERAASYGTATTTTTTTTAGMPASGIAAAPASAATSRTGGEEVINLSEEELAVGKRLVNRGTTRVRRFVVETPVEEAVTLHSEHVTIERRPVTGDTTVTNPDFSDRTIEVTETDEEAVVAKTARVKEEVVINKAATDRVETVRDTVRREEVEITRDGDGSRTSGTTGAAPRPARPGV